MSLHQPVDHMASYVDEGRQLAQEHPLSSAAVAFGMGVATGWILVNLLPDAPSHRDQNIAFRLGQHLLDTMSSVVPDAFSRSLGR